MSTRVLLVDDHRIMREGLRALLQGQRNLDVIGEADDGRTALDMAAEMRPDLVVMDVGLPDLNGIEATRQLVASQPEVRVIALSMHSDKRYVLQMLRAGAKAYLLKNTASEELLRAVKAVMAGESFLSPGIAGMVIEEMKDDAAPSRASAYSLLSGREREVLQLLAEGKTSRGIAEDLHLATRTIETHRREIMRKLDLHSVAELTKYAIREGLTTLDR